MVGEQRRLEKLMLCLQGMLHRLNTNEGEEDDPAKAVTERARQLHARYRVFMNGNCGAILDQGKKEGEQDRPTQRGKTNTTE